MNYPLISEYVEAIKLAEDNFEELSYLRPVLGDDGLPVMTSGNFAVVFKMKDEQSGKYYAVKCFTKEQEGRTEAYREIIKELIDVSSPYILSIRYLEKELFVDTDQTTETEFPVLLMDWVEGKTLDKYLRENLDDKYALKMLAYRFSQLAQWLILQPFAHGDLKPDNILVREDGTLVLVDYDGMYVPSMKGQKARELGSPDFRHPQRTAEDFNEFIDDFPIATILFSLYQIAKDPSLLEKYGSGARLLLSSQDYYDIGSSELMHYLYPSGSAIDMSWHVFYFTFLDRSFKNVWFSWFRILDESLLPPKKVSPPKIKIVFNGAIINMIYVEGGTYFMGEQEESIERIRMANSNISTLRNTSRIRECSVREVNVGSFWISDSLVTMDIWPYAGEIDPNNIELFIEKRSIDDNRFAVSGESYDDCKKFMRTLSKATNIKFDFPTEIEWEYAARGGVNSNSYEFSGSDLIDEVAVYGRPYYELDGIPLCQVKTKKPNKLGIYDMSGGLYEWCKDSLDDNMNSLNKIRSHHIRGGCMNSQSEKCRVSYKSLFYEKEYYEWEPFWWQVGLRLVTRDIDLNRACNNSITSLSGYATEDEINEAITDEFGATYSRDGSKIISVPKETITYKIRKGVRVICHDAFNSSRIEIVTLPDSLLLIGAQAFWGCKYLKEIIIPSNVYRIGLQAFWGCDKLEKITIPNSVNYIDSMAFGGCKKLKNCILPSNLDVLEESLFSFCSSLNNILLSDKLEVINQNVFWNCKSLQAITIPKNVNEIEDNPFRGSGITKIECETPNFVFENGLLMTADKTELIACLTDVKYISVPPSIKIIRGHAFNGCKTIEQVFLPEGLTDLMDSAIRDCTSLSELTIPSSVKAVHRSFLSECSSLRKLIIHSTDIWFEDRSAFYKVESLSQIIIPQEIRDKFVKQFSEYSEIIESY